MTQAHNILPLLRPQPLRGAAAVPLESDIRELSPKRIAKTAARTMIEALVAAGVDTFFGIPGGPIAEAFDAAFEMEGVRLIESRHETSAVFEAIGYYRQTGRVPAVMVTAGPGITNAVTGIASAHFERVPMIVISGDVAWSATGGKLLQNCGPEGLDVESMFQKVVRSSVRIAQPRSAATQMLAALQSATNPANPGPALVVLPIHTGSAKTQTPRLMRSDPAPRLSAPPQEAVLDACRSLANAERPLIVLGAGCRPYAKAIRRMLDAFDVPFVTTPRAKGIVSENHPRSLHHGGLAASIWARKYTDPKNGGVDVALVLGTDLDDCSVGPTRYIKDDGKLIHVDTDPTVFNRNLTTDLAVVSDVGDFVNAMYDAVAREGLHHAESVARLREIKESAAYDESGLVAEINAPITPARAIRDLESAAGDARFITDIGEHMLFALHYLTAKGPDSFDIGLGLGSMGSGIAGSIGLALGGAKRVVCVCGDGGMQMVGMEALVAVKHKLPILFAVFNDARYNMVYHGMKTTYGSEAKWETPWVDFAAWGRSLGMNGARIHRAGEITPELIDKLLADGPAVLDIRIDRSKRVAGGGRVEALIQMSMLAEES
jgi:acetolactate synthase-1/2/3 large subunit